MNSSLLRPESLRRILMTTDAVGGVWDFSLDLARTLGDLGVEVLLAVMGPPPSGLQRAHASRLANVTLAEGPCALEWMENPWAEVDAAGRWLLRLESEFEPDTIHLNGFVHAVLPWSAPVLVAAHSCVLTWWRAVHGTSAPASFSIYRRRVRLGLEAAGLVVSPTAALLTAIEDEYGELASTRIIPNGRDVASFAPGAKRETIFSAGRVWDEAKNIAFLDRVAPRLPWTIEVAGSREMAGQTAAPCKHLHFLGKLAPVDMASALAAASIYAAPAKYEPFGLAVLEAALSGCALALADIPTFREIWGDSALFIPLNENAWAEALQHLVTHPVRRAELGRAARRRAARYSLEAMTEGYLSAYGQLHVQSRPHHQMVTA